jgi:hypothetical protein
MKNLWSGFGGIKEKAEEAFSIAKKNFKEMALDPEGQENEKNATSDLEKLKTENLRLKEQLDEKHYEIQQYIGEIKNLQKNAKAVSQDSDKIIDFKIIIGMEESARALELMKESDTELALYKSDLSIYKKNYLELQEKIKSIEENNQNLINKIQEKSKNITILEEKILNYTQKIAEQQEKILSLQDSMLQSKKNFISNVEKCYATLKESCSIVGIPIPQVKPDNLGLEDIQEFLLTQTQFISENMNEIFKSLSGKSNTKQVKSLDGIKDTILFTIEDTSKKIMEYKEISTTCEAMFQQSKKENFELIKKINENAKVLEDLKKNLLKKDEENLKLKDIAKLFGEVKAENEKNKMLLKKNNDAYATLEYEFDEEKKKFEKTYSYVSTLEEETLESKKEIKNFQNSITEKNKIIASLNEEKNIISVKFNEHQKKTSNEISDIRAFYEDKIKDLNEKYLSEKTKTEEACAAKVLEIQNSLAKALNEAKDLNIAKIQVNKYQQGIERLQELVKNLEKELSNSSVKLDKLAQENEIFSQKVTKKTQKILDLKKFNSELAMSLNQKVQEIDKEKQNIEYKLKETEEMKKQAEILLEKVQSKIQADDDLIDRRLVITFLVNYLNQENTEKIKLQMLKPLAEMLGMDKQQKQKIGLEQDQGLLAQFANFLTKG